MKKISDSLKRRQKGRTRKTKIARKGLAQRRGEKGDAVKYMTRNKALKKLQVTLKDFRRLCILKGIYPRDPSKKVSGRNKTYYFSKDIAFLAHEPVLAKFRETKAFMKKVKKALGRGRKSDAQRLWETQRPVYTLDHLVRERYPTFVDALRDLDDALCMVHLFAVLPRGKRIPAGRSENCARLAREFQCYVAKSHSLRKCFLSVKGVYYQAEIMGQTVTWLAPFAFAQVLPNNVDYRVMLTFLQFYETALRFVNFRLFHGLGLSYPPTFLEDKDVGGGFIEALELAPIGQGAAGDGSGADADGSKAAQDRDAAIAEAGVTKGALRKIQGKVDRIASQIDDAAADGDQAENAEGDGDDDAEGEFGDAEEVVELRRRNREEAVCEELFADCVMYFSREVPRASIELVARSFGATVGWDGPGSPIAVDDESITHVITDRDPKHIKMVAGRHYVQPQWVVDSANERIVLPSGSYAPGATLPPHLSPFVDDNAIGYTPDQRKRLDALKERLANGMLVDDKDSLEAIIPDALIDGPAGSDDEEEDADDDDSSDDSDEADSSDEEEESDVEVDEAEAAYRAELEGERKGKDAEAAGRRAVSAIAKKRKRAAAEAEREDAEMARVMMSKKDRRLFGQINHSNRKKKEAAQKLEERKRAIKAAKAD